MCMSISGDLPCCGYLPVEWLYCLSPPTPTVFILLLLILSFLLPVSLLVTLFWWFWGVWWGLCHINYVDDIVNTNWLICRLGVSSCCGFHVFYPFPCLIEALNLGLLSRPLYLSSMFLLSCLLAWITIEYQYIAGDWLFFSDSIVWFCFYVWSHMCRAFIA